MIPVVTTHTMAIDGERGENDMAKFTNRERLLPDDTRERFKYEIAGELGLMDDISQRGWGDMPSRELGRIGGKIGGNMVKVMIRHAEEAMHSESETD